MSQYYFFFHEREQLSSSFHISMKRHRIFENLKLSVNVVMYRYSPVESIATVNCLVKVCFLMFIENYWN